MVEYCCPLCFEDRFLRTHIDTYSKRKGECCFCKNRHASLLEASKLFDLFLPLASLYVENESGCPLSTQLQRDWNIFSSKIPKTKRLALLSQILGYSVNHKQYTPRIALAGEAEKRWKDFSYELKH